MTSSPVPPIHETLRNLLVEVHNALAGWAIQKKVARALIMIERQAQPTPDSALPSAGIDELVEALTEAAEQIQEPGINFGCKIISLEKAISIVRQQVTGGEK